MPESSERPTPNRGRGRRNYDDRLRNADDEITRQIRGLISHTRVLLWVNQIGYFLTVPICLFLIIYGAIIVFSAQDLGAKEIVGLVGMFLGLLILFILSYRNPMRTIRHHLGSIAKVSVVYLGTLRQMKQADKAVRRSEASTEEVSVEEMTAYNDNLQAIIDAALEQINQAMEVND